jgi:hypothetical protein
VRQPKERWIPRTEIDIAEVAQGEPERRKHLILGIGVLTGCEVVDLLRQGSALVTWRYISNFELPVT